MARPKFGHDDHHLVYVVALNLILTSPIGAIKIKAHEARVMNPFHFFVLFPGHQKRW